MPFGLRQAQTERVEACGEPVEPDSPRTHFIRDVGWVERSDKIAGSDFGQPKAGPEGGVQGWTPQTQHIDAFLFRWVSLSLSPTYGNRSSVQAPRLLVRSNRRLLWHNDDVATLQENVLLQIFPFFDL